jgi:hypothetical protein
MKHLAIQIPLYFLIATAVMLPRCNATAAAVNLGDASSFAVLAGAGITITGPTTITGDIGTSPTLSITGTENLILDGGSYAGGTIAQSAQTALTTAYNAAAGTPYNVSYVEGFDLVGQTLAPGVYNDASSLFLSGTLTLDATGNPNAVWIFQTGSTLITAALSKVVLINGAQAGNVYWQVGTSATLGTGTSFAGSILALDSVTVDTGAAVDGRLLAQTGAVTLDNNVVAVPEGRTFLLLGLGMATLVAFRRQFSPCVAKAGRSSIL